MQVQAHIIQYCDSTGKPILPETCKVISGEPVKITKYNPRNDEVIGIIKVRCYDDDGDGYWFEDQYVRVLETFTIITHGQFIRNTSDTSKLNSHLMSGGSNSVYRLAYHYSVSVVKSYGQELYDSDVIWSSSGIKATEFDMYSYHVNQPEQKYTEDRLDWEVFNSLNLNKIFSKWLSKSDIRDNKLEDLGL